MALGAGADLVIRIATKGAELASAQMKGIGNSANTSGKSLSKFSNVAKAGVVTALYAIVKAGAESIQTFMKFEDALNQSLAIMKTTEAQQQAMSEAARQVGISTRISAEDSAEAFFFLASAGLDAEQSISALPQVAAFAQAGMFDMATATDLATDAQSALGLTVLDAQQNLSNLTRVTDVLVKANTLANASVQQFSEALTTKAGAALKVVNKDIEEGVAVLAVFADRGVKGAEAGDKLNQVLRDIPRATAKNKEEFEALGLQMFDAQGNMKNVADIIEELDAVLGPMSDELKASTLDQLGLNRGVADAVKILSGSTDQIRRYEEALRDSGGTTQEVADNQMKSLQAQTEVMSSKFNELGLIIGEALAPAMEKTVGFISRMLDVIIEATDGTDKYIDSQVEFINLLGASEGIAFSYNNELNNTLVAQKNNREETLRLAKVYSDYSKAIQYQALIEKDLINNAHELDRETGSLNKTKEITIELTEEEIEAERELAEERETKSLGALQKVLSAYQKLQRIQENVNDLQNEEKKKLNELNKAINKKSQAETDLEKAKAELTNQQELSKLVTLEEEYAIERAREALARAEEQVGQSKIADLEYELAKKALEQAIIDSTSSTQAEERALRDVESAEKDLARETENVKKAQEEYRQAQEDLAKATANSTENLLAMAIAKKELDDAIADAEALGALEEGLKQMVASVGGDLDYLRSQFESIFSMAGKKVSLPAVSTPTTTGGNGNGGGGGGGGVIFPASGGAEIPQNFGPTSPIARHTTNVITVNPQAILGTPTEIEEAVARALQEGARRGINVAF